MPVRDRGAAGFGSWNAASGRFAIGLRPISEAEWFEGGEAEHDVRARKQALLDAAPERVWAEADGSRPAQAEAAALIGAVLGGPVAGEPPLLAAGMRTPDDLCLMERREGDWTLTALSLSAGTFFTAAEVVGRPLAALHAPVPGFGDQMLPRVLRIFDHLPSATIVERRNWTVVNSDALHLPDAAAVRADLAALAPEAGGAGLHLRTERQTLRRLPVCGGLLFTIRVWTEPLARIAEDRDRLAGLAQAWRSAAPEFRAYKRLDLYDRWLERLFAEAGVLASGE